MRFCLSSIIFVPILQLNLLLRVHGDKQNKTDTTKWPKNDRRWPKPQFDQLLGFRQGPSPNQYISSTTLGGLGETTMNRKAAEDAMRQYDELLILRQGPTNDLLSGFTPPGGLGGTKMGGQAKDDAKRFSTPSTTAFRKRRTQKEYISLNEPCDYIAINCLRGYQTGRLCARSGYWRYYTFKNYCMMDFVNCRMRYETWQVIHMGDCLWIKPITEYFAVDYWNSGLMEGYYVLDRSN